MGQQTYKIGKKHMGQNMGLKRTYENEKKSKIMGQYLLLTYYCTVLKKQDFRVFKDFSFKMFDLLI